MRELVKLDHVGDVAPALLATLNTGEKVLVPIDQVRYRDPTVKVDRVTLTFPNPVPNPPMGLKTLSLWFESLEGPGSATISAGKVGEFRIMTLGPGESYLLHHASLMAMESTVRLSEVILAAYNTMRSTYPAYFKAMHLQGPGRFAIQTRGNVLSFELRPGETVRAPPYSVVGLKPGVQVRAQVFGGPPAFPRLHYFPLVDLTGPGNVLLHSGLPVVG